MNLSRNWLSDFVDTKEISDQEFCDRMTITGSKVEGFEVFGADIENVVVARVTKMEKHPDSDHLWVCRLDAGEKFGHDIQIVTGAQNVFVGALVPAALPVAKLPGDVTIKAGKLRGVESDGMLCSMGELKLTAHDMPGKEENGILILDEDCADRLGDDIRDVLMLRDTAVEFEITSNRPDCLSVIGLAREAAVSFGKPLTVKQPQVKGTADGDSVNNYLNVTISAPDLCYRYAARVVKNVKIAPSPLWMRMRLRASGVRPINNIVDITNYVMLEYGQPMHAFDYQCLDGAAINVRRAKAGEVFRALDDTEHTLDDTMLVIADRKKACALAGVMGGANSEITADTKTVVFESACFMGASVRVTAKKNGMRTESSARFEKGLDRENCPGALERACELVELLGCGEVMRGTIDVLPEPIVPKTVKLEPDKVNGLLGTDVSKAEMRRILLALGFELDGDTIIVPSWRGDVEHYSDIAEEIARFYGYNNIPCTLMRGQTTSGGYTDAQKAERSIGTMARALGYSEIITYSFISPSYYDKIRLPADSPLRDSMKILNPLGEDTSIMRTTILPSMLEILTRNYNYRNKAVRLYEIGKVYFARPDGMADEPKLLCLGGYGGGMDFFQLKGAVERILAGLRITDVTFEAEHDNPSYHPGRCAKVYAGGKLLGVLGQIHPLAAANYGVDAELYTAELWLGELLAARGATPVYTPLPRFPAVTRDIAIVCAADIPVAKLSACILAAGGQYLKGCELFDVYTGAPIPVGYKSVAFSLTLRADDQTLTDDHAEETMQSVLKALKETFNATIR